MSRWFVIKFVVLLCLIRRWFQRYHLSKNMILLILWQLLLIVSMFQCLCLFVSLSKIRKKILFSFLWDFRSQNHLKSCFFLIFRMSCFFLLFFMLCLFLRLFLMSCLFFLLVFLLCLRAIIAIRSLFVDFVFFRKSFKRDFTFYFIFQLI